MKLTNVFKTLIVCSLLVVWAAFTPGSVHAEESWPGKKTYTVGFAQDTLANDWRKAQVNEVRQALKPYPFIKFIVKDAKGRTSNQVLDIADLTDDGVDAIITSPRDGKALTPVISRAHKMGIPVILLSRTVLNDDYTTFIAPDNYTIAHQAGERMASIMGGKGNILVLQGIATSSTAVARTNGFVDALKPYPGMKIAAITPANYLRADALHVVEDALTAGMKIDGIYAQSDSMADGARVALQKGGVPDGSVPIIGIDYISSARDAIRDGSQDSSFTYPTGGIQGAEVIVKIFKGEAVPQKIKIPSTMVTKENVEDVTPIF